MRYLVLVLVSSALILGIHLESGAQSFFSANLTTSQQPNGATGEGSGTAAFVLTDEGLRFFVSVDSLTGDIAAAHIHMARAGESGGVVRTLSDDFSGNSASGVWTSADTESLTPELMEALWKGMLYVNVHTAENQSGEIRGQIYPSSGVGFTADLTTDQETHDVEGTATGTASVLLSGSTVLYSLTFSGLTDQPAAAHFHNGAMGENGGVVKTITDDFNGPTAVGIWTSSDDEALTPELINELLLGNLYFNVHTPSNGAGEIRGQIIARTGEAFDAVLQSADGSTEGRGAASVFLTEAGLVYDITVSGLTGPIIASHFHNAAEGENGDVVSDIEFSDGNSTGVWSPNDSRPLTDILIDELRAGRIYVNVHTTANPGGEIRGQLLPRSGTVLSASLDPSQETADVESDGVGTAIMELTEEGLSFNVTVDSLSGDISGAHFHSGAAGTDGGVVRAITDDFTGTSAQGVWTASDDQPLTPELMASLLKGDLYLNVHTADNPSGEIRGQVLLRGATTLWAGLDASQPTGDISSSGSGTAALVATPAGVVYKLTVDSLTGPIANAHFHSGRAGGNGGVVKSIMPDFVENTAAGVWRPDDEEPLSAENLESLALGGLYLNIHTAANPGGEIRGQVRTNSGIGSAVQLDPGQETGDVDSDGAGTASITATNLGILFQLTHEGLSGPLTGAHFHNAPFGENGGVVRDIGDDFGSPTASGLWTSADEQPLTAELMSAFFDGELYLNLHTAENPGGEIRGQIQPGQAVVTAIERIAAEIPDQVTLHANYPNPFNPSTRITFELDESAPIKLEVFNTLGRRVATLVNRPLTAGSYGVTFEAADLPSGVYFARLTTGAGQPIIRAMTLTK